MKAYELLFFVDPASTEEVRAGVMKRIDVAITTDGGVVDSGEDWGKRINDAVKRHMIVRRVDKD